MARETTKKVITKKHLARLERERQQKRYIMISTLVVLGAVILLVTFGILEATVLRPNQAVARVENERITTREFQANARYMRQGIVQRYYEMQQLMQMFGEDPNTQQYLQSNLAQIAAQLNTDILGEQVLETMIEDRIIRQEAERLGITVTRAEVETALQEAFGYYESGTPTPTEPVPTRPVSTLSPAQLALITPTPAITPTTVPETEEEAETPETEEPLETEAPEVEETEEAEEAEETPEEEPEIAATATPAPTATPYTRDAFESTYRETMDNFSNNINFTEADFYRLFESQLYREKVMEAVIGELPRDQEMFWTRQIQVTDQDTANELFERLASGEDFGALASEYSLDSFSFSGGDQGWLLLDELDPAVAEEITELSIGELSNPIQTSFGWTIVQLVGREVRTIEAQRYDQLRMQKFQEWLDVQRESKNVEIFDIWRDRVPTSPDIVQGF